MRRLALARGMRAAALTVVALVAAHPARAQLSGPPVAGAHGVETADSLLRAGRVRRAEALYYQTMRAATRDPAARYALGRYLGSRGASRVGAVLIEEGRRFGGDPSVAAMLLVPLYERLDDHAALLALPTRMLDGDRRARALYLRTAGTPVEGPDSAATPLLRATPDEPLGAVTIVVGTDTVRATIDAEAEGLVLDRAQQRGAGVRRFGERLGVVDRVTIGGLVARNAAVTFGSAGGAGRARVGLDWMLRWSPTIDLRRGTLTLRRAGRVAIRPGATRYPMLRGAPGRDGSTMPGIWLGSATGLLRLDAATLTAFGIAAFTADGRRGEFVVLP